MGGKSRKSGEISKKLIDRLKKGSNSSKAASASCRKKSEKSPIQALLEEEKTDV